jgi:hypothetical protein
MLSHVVPIARMPLPPCEPAHMRCATLRRPRATGLNNGEVVLFPTQDNPPSGADLRHEIGDPLLPGKGQE